MRAREIATIETELTAAGHDVSDILHGILAKHLTLENIAAHVAQGAGDGDYYL